MTVRSGAFCAPPGASDATNRGTPMVCAMATGGRHRWQSTGNPDAERAARRKLLDRARAAGVKVRRNQPDTEIEQAIKEALAEPQPAGPDPAGIAGQLEQATTREQGHKLLADLKLNRQALVTLAKSLDILAPRNDSMATIRSRIVETMVGGRVDANAMHGQSWRNPPPVPASTYE